MRNKTLMLRALGSVRCEPGKTVSLLLRTARGLVQLLYERQEYYTSGVYITTRGAKICIRG